MADNYEIVPLNEVKKLKEEINLLKKETEYAPSSVVAKSLERLANSLDSLFKIFQVAATDVEQETLEEKSFEEKISPLLNKLEDIEQQNKDIAEGLLALADIVKKQNDKNSLKSKIKTYGEPKPLPVPQPSAPQPIGTIPPAPTNNIPPPMPNNTIPPPVAPPKIEKKGLFHLK